MDTIRTLLARLTGQLNQGRTGELLSLIIVAVILAGCGSSPRQSTNPDATPGGSSGGQQDTAKGEPVELTFAMNALAPEIPGWTAQVDAANKQLASKNIKIKIQKIPAAGWGEYYQKVVAQIAAGRSPDIGRIAESFMPQLIAKGQVLDITSTVSEMDMKNYYEAPFKSSAYRDGKYYGIPSGTYNMVMYYNKDMFDKAGLKYPSSDWDNAITFEQVREYARKLTEGEGGAKKFGFSAGPFMAFIGMYSMSNGGKNVFDENGKCALTQPQSLEVYRWFDAMLRTDRSQPRPTDTKVVSALDMFKSGRLAMMVDGTWSHAPIKDIKSFKVGIAAVPSGKGKAYSSQFVDSWVVWKGTKHPTEAAEALKALNSKEALDALAATGVGGTPIQKQTLSELKDKMIGTQFGPQDQAAFMGALEHGLSVPYNESYQEIDDKVNASMDEWLLGKISPEQFAEKVCGIVNAAAKQ